MKIKNITGTIAYVVTLSETAREVKIALDEPIDFVAGSFVNIFMNINGENVRRAYSISSPDGTNNKEITVAMRLLPDGKMSGQFRDTKMIGQKVKIMGPLGLNTADKMVASKIFLFGFGVGNGVIKSLADHFKNKDAVEKIVIVTGNKTENEILYRKYLDKLTGENSIFEVKHVISRPDSETSAQIKRGYIQDNIDEYDFNSSSVFVCGAEKACIDLVNKIRATRPENCSFLIEGFH